VTTTTGSVPDSAAQGAGEPAGETESVHSRDSRNAVPPPAPAARRRWWAGITPIRIIAVLLVSATAGVVVALLALPAAALVGLTAKSSADDFMSLPTDLLVPPLAQGSRITDAHGHTIATLTGSEDRTVVTLSQVAPVMRQAIVDIEDSRFYTHRGLDFKGLARAFFTNQENGTVTQGGSTLSQQYVKNVLIESARTKSEMQSATADTVARKLREARYALFLEDHLSKDQILAGYLNIAYFGDGAYGIEAAAKHYFDVPASQLTLTEAATLAGVVKNPTAFDPALHPAGGRDRRDTVLDVMHKLHHLSDAQWRSAKAAPLGLHRAPKAVDSCAVSKQPYFCAYVRQSLLADPTFGSTMADRERRLFEGGLTIHTSLDPAAQQAAEAAVDTVVPPGSSVAAAVAVVQPGTGNVLALAQNRTYGPFSDGKSVEATNDFTHTEEIIPAESGTFSPGSTFKVFTLAAAIDHGIPLNTTFDAPPCYHSDVLDNPAGAGCAGGDDGSYHNAEDGEGGIFSLTTATWNSVNTYYVQLEEKVGVLNVASMARRLGVSSPTIDPDYVNPYTGKPDAVTSREGSLTLGDRTVSPLDMATAYATLAAHGMRCDPRPIVSITDHVGTTDRPVPFTAPGACHQAVSRHVADTVSAVLEGVITQGTGYPNASIGRPAAGKTGTAQDFKDAWFAGYIPQLSVAVAVGDPRGPESHLLADAVGTQNAFGGVFPAKIWSATMTGTINALNLPVAPMPPPDETQPSMPKVTLPDVVGEPYVIARPELEALGFKVTLKAVGSAEPAGIVVKMSPKAAEVPFGATVTLSVSTESGTLSGGGTLTGGGTLPGGGAVGTGRHRGLGRGGAPAR
jgi:membrane peptidoglycan carboxypeptidase